MTDLSRVAMRPTSTAIMTTAHDLATAEGVEFATLVRDRELYPGAGQAYVTRRLDPLPTVRAAHLIHQGAAEAEVAAILDARSLGHSWEELAEALGLVDLAVQAELAVGYAAWRYAVWGILPGQERPHPRLGHAPVAPVVRWRCNGCHYLVSEGSPLQGELDAEEGHGPSCTRRRAALDAKRLADEAAAAKVGTFVPERDGYLQADGSVNCAAACPMGCTGCAL